MAGDHDYATVWYGSYGEIGARGPRTVLTGSLHTTELQNVQARSKEAGCPDREGPLSRDRGEAAGDCVGTREPFCTAAVDRTIALPSPGFEAPARFVEKYRTGK